MIGFLIALYEEAELVIQELSFHRINSIGQHNGYLNGCPVSIHLCGVGVKRRSHVFRWLSQHKFERIINIGYAGALTKGSEIGDLYQIGRLGKLNEDDIMLDTKSNEYIITAENPVFSYDEKENLSLKTRAKFVDMEAYSLAQILIEANFPLAKFDVFKLVGDLPEDALYLRHEVKFRNFFRTYSLWQKLLIAFSTGLSNSYFLYNRKKFLQKRIYQYVLERVE